MAAKISALVSEEQSESKREKILVQDVQLPNLPIFPTWKLLPLSPATYDKIAD